MNTLRRTFITAIVFFFVTSIASGKVSLSKIFIFGGNLSQPLEITNPKLLQSSNPWFGTFIQQWNQRSLQQVNSPPDGVQRYQLDFYAASSPQGPSRLIYVVYYAFDSVARRGFVYLPGPHEQWYYKNTGSILRPHQDGHWNIADPAWCDQVNSIVARGEATAARESAEGQAIPR